MNQDQAMELAKEYLVEVQQRCPVEISLNDELTEEHPIGFVFFYNSTEYWKTGDFMDALAGNCPILIKKLDGSVATLPANQSVEKSIAELNPC